MPQFNYFRSPTLQILAGTSASLALSFGSVWLWGTYASNMPTPSMPVIIILFATLFLSYIIPFATLLLSIYRSFQQTGHCGNQLQIILLSYLSMIVVFSGVYFSMAFIGDYDYAIDHYFYYHFGGEDLASGRINRLNPYPTASRSFIGIEERLWGTVDDYIPLGIYRDLQEPEIYRARWAARLAVEDAVQFRPMAIPSVLSDCLHLSVITITTTGYGNISPYTWYAKLATNVEALTGTALLVVALGLVLSGFGHDERKA